MHTMITANSAAYKLHVYYHDLFYPQKIISKGQYQGEKNNDILQVSRRIKHLSDIYCDCKRWH